MRSRRVLTTAFLVVNLAALSAQSAHGDDLFDWMFGSSPSAGQRVVVSYGAMPATYPASVAVPHQAYYGGMPGTMPSDCGCQSPVQYQVATPSACCGPTVVYQSPDEMCGPAVPVECEPPRQSCWDRLTSCFGGRGSNAAATATYRTTWKQIPVTRYRPIVSADPITGCPVTVMKPCTTYTWQPQRQRCGFFGRLFGQCDPGPAANYCCPDPCAVTPGVVISDSCGCGTPALAPQAVPTPAAAPYYSPGAPAGSIPAGTPTPAVPSGVPNLAPGALNPGAFGTPGTGAAGGGVPEPADVRPSLRPSLDATNGTTDAALTPLPSANSQLGTGSGDTASPSPGDAAGAGAYANPPSQTILNRQVELPSLGDPPGPSLQQRPTPVPDPDATPTHIEHDSAAPQLLNPKDQVAVLQSRQGWAVTTITWPVSERRRTPAQPAVTTTPRRVRPELDESGWYSIAR